MEATKRQNTTKKSWFKLLKKGRVFSSRDEGIQDILIIKDKIYMISQDIPEDRLWETEVIDCSGKIICPGFIDQHLHITGGGGEEGPGSSVPELMLGDIIRAGVTTVVGVLGTDSITRSTAGLLAKARALQKEGITAYIYTGSYGVPLTTLTGRVASDIALIPEVIGAGEIAIADHRSGHLNLQALKELASDVRIGGLIGGKAGVLHLHVGDGKSGLKPLFQLIEETDFPREMFVPTHLNRNQRLFQEAVHFTRQGGNIDLTAGENFPEAYPVPEALEFLMKNKVSTERVTISSDGNGSLPLPEKKGYGLGEIGWLFNDFRSSVKEWGLDLSAVLSTVTANPARVLHLCPQKGCLAEGSDADILVLDGSEMNIEMVIARGEFFIRQGDLIRKGFYEK